MSIYNRNYKENKMADPTPAPNPNPFKNPALVKFVVHIGYLLLWGGLSVAIMPAFAALSHLDTSSWPLAAQSIYTLLLPIGAQLVATWKAAIDAALQAEENAKLVAKNAALQAKNLLLEGKAK